MSRVFVVNIPKRDGRYLDISDAKRFGDVIEPIFNSQPRLDKDIDSVVDVISDFFDSAEFCSDDYILQVGEHTIFTIACLVASTVVDSVKVLKYDRILVKGRRCGGCYTEVVIPIYTD